MQRETGRGGLGGQEEGKGGHRERAAAGTGSRDLCSRAELRLGQRPGDVLTFHHQVQVVAVLRPSGGLIIDAAIKPGVGFTY